MAATGWYLGKRGDGSSNAVWVDLHLGLRRVHGTTGTDGHDGCHLQAQQFPTLAVKCPPMSEPPLSERDVCTKLITPAVERAGWDIQSQVREEVSLTAGKVMVRGQLVARGKAKRADYVLYLKPNLSLTVIEAKEPNHRVGDGMQQALEYAEMLGVPFAFSSNGAGFLFGDRTGQASKVEAELKLDQFPKGAAYRGRNP